MDGKCQLPYYPNRYFRRQVINWMIENHQKVHKYMGSVLKASYGIPDPTASHGVPFSYKTYLTKLMDRSFWGDKVVLWSVFMMWGLKIMMVNSKTLQEYRVHHDTWLLGWCTMPAPTILLLVSQAPGCVSHPSETITSSTNSNTFYLQVFMVCRSRCA